jgi:hypothetical protein
MENQKGRYSDLRVRSGILAAVSRIAGILPSELAPTNMNGPLPTFTKIDLTAARHTKSGHSYTLQHFRPRRSASRTFPPFAATANFPLFF